MTTGPIGEREVFGGPPPASAGCGAALRPLWALQDGITYLNHGAYGATPHEVLRTQSEIRMRLEAQPCRFMADELPAALRSAAAELAEFVGVQGRDLVFVENATAGINAVLGSIDFADGDEVVMSDHTYPAVHNALRHHLQGTGARLVTAGLGLPVAGPEQVLSTFRQAVTARTRLVVIDHVGSMSAVIFPIDQIARLCRAEGCQLLVDGAHAPGMLDLDIGALGVDWYVGNCHKWLCAPKGAGFLWADAAVQPGLHPTVISHGWGQGLTAEFDCVGTRDPSAWLAVPAAIAFHERLGGGRLRDRNRALAAEAMGMAAAALGTEPGGPPELFGSMATVRLPPGLPATQDAAMQLRHRIWEDHRTEVAINRLGDALWLRISAYAYNDAQDYVALGPNILESIRSVLDTG